jgi:hypothetical protein
MAQGRVEEGGMSWIKMETDLREKTEVFRLSDMMGVSRYEIVGMLHRFWSWCDSTSVDGVVDGGASQHIDEVVDKDGFAKCLACVGWLEIHDGKLIIPKHDRHNGEGAKQRALKSERQKKWRQGVASETQNRVDGHVDGVASTREEKRRSNTPISPKRKPTLEEWKAKAVPRGMTESEALRTWSYYESVDWMRGKTPISKWENCITTCLKDKSQPKGSAVSISDAREAAR